MSFFLHGFWLDNSFCIFCYIIDLSAYSPTVRRAMEWGSRGVEFRWNPLGDRATRTDVVVQQLYPRGESNSVSWVTWEVRGAGVRSRNTTGPQ